MAGGFGCGGTGAPEDEELETEAGGACWAIAPGRLKSKPAVRTALRAKQRNGETGTEKIGTACFEDARLV